MESKDVSLGRDTVQSSPLRRGFAYAHKHHELDKVGLQMQPVANALAESRRQPAPCLAAAGGKSEVSNHGRNGIGFAISPRKRIDARQAVAAVHVSDGGSPGAINNSSRKRGKNDAVFGVLPTETSNPGSSAMMFGELAVSAEEARRIREALYEAEQLLATGAQRPSAAVAAGMRTPPRQVRPPLPPGSGRMMSSGKRRPPTQLLQASPDDDDDDNGGTGGHGGQGLGQALHFGPGASSSDVHEQPQQHRPVAVPYPHPSAPAQQQQHRSSSASAASSDSVDTVPEGLGRPLHQAGLGRTGVDIVPEGMSRGTGMRLPVLQQAAVGPKAVVSGMGMGMGLGVGRTGAAASVGAVYHMSSDHGHDHHHDYGAGDELDVSFTQAMPPDDGPAAGVGAMHSQAGAGHVLGHESAHGSHDDQGQDGDEDEDMDMDLLPPEQSSMWSQEREEWQHGGAHGGRGTGDTAMSGPHVHGRSTRASPPAPALVRASEHGHDHDVHENQDEQEASEEHTGGAGDGDSDDGDGSDGDDDEEEDDGDDEDEDESHLEPPAPDPHAQVLDSLADQAEEEAAMMMSQAGDMGMGNGAGMGAGANMGMGAGAAIGRPGPGVQVPFGALDTDQSYSRSGVTTGLHGMQLATSTAGASAAPTVFPTPMAAATAAAVPRTAAPVLPPSASTSVLNRTVPLSHPVGSPAPTPGTGLEKWTGPALPMPRGCDMLLARTLAKQVLGHEQLRPAQLRSLPMALAGRDMLLVLPTGAGKTVCYALPALVMPGLSVVILPLVALMTDQLRGLADAGIPAAALHHGMAPEQQAAVLAKVRALGRMSSEQCGPVQSQAAGAGALSSSSSSTFHISSGAAPPAHRWTWREPLKVLLLTPERLTSSTSLLEALQDCARVGTLARFVVDEAHCVTEWGASWRKDYAELRWLRPVFPRVPITALTATATPQTQEGILQTLGMRIPAPGTATGRGMVWHPPAKPRGHGGAVGMGDPIPLQVPGPAMWPAVVIAEASDRPNLKLIVSPKTSKAEGMKLAVLYCKAQVAAMEAQERQEARARAAAGAVEADADGSGTTTAAAAGPVPVGAGIVYCSFKSTVEATCRALQEAGVAASYYHADVEPEAKAIRAAEWRAGRIRVMVATVAFGMGIDHPHVRFVLHTSVPSSLSSYAQEVGRAGRDGKPAECLLLYSDSDRSFHSAMIKEDYKKGLGDIEAVEAGGAAGAYRHGQGNGYGQGYGGAGGYGQGTQFDPFGDHPHHGPNVSMGPAMARAAAASCELKLRAVAVLDAATAQAHVAAMAAVPGAAASSAAHHAALPSYMHYGTSRASIFEPPGAARARVKACYQAQLAALAAVCAWTESRCWCRRAALSHYFAHGCVPPPGPVRAPAAVPATQATSATLLASVGTPATSTSTSTIAPRHTGSSTTPLPSPSPSPSPCCDYCLFVGSMGMGMGMGMGSGGSAAGGSMSASAGAGDGPDATLSSSAATNSTTTGLAFPERYLHTVRTCGLWPGPLGQARPSLAGLQWSAHAPEESHSHSASSLLPGLNGGSAAVMTIAASVRRLAVPPVLSTSLGLVTLDLSHHARLLLAEVAAGPAGTLDGSGSGASRAGGWAGRGGYRGGRGGGSGAASSSYPQPQAEYTLRQAINNLKARLKLAVDSSQAHARAVLDEARRDEEEVEAAAVAMAYGHDTEAVGMGMGMGMAPRLGNSNGPGLGASGARPGPAPMVAVSPPVAYGWGATEIRAAGPPTGASGPYGGFPGLSGPGLTLEDLGASEARADAEMGLGLPAHMDRGGQGGRGRGRGRGRARGGASGYDSSGYGHGSGYSSRGPALAQPALDPVRVSSLLPCPVPDSLWLMLGRELIAANILQESCSLGFKGRVDARVRLSPGCVGTLAHWRVDVQGLRKAAQEAAAAWSASQGGGDLPPVPQVLMLPVVPAGVLHILPVAVRATDLGAEIRKGSASSAAGASSDLQLEDGRALHEDEEDGGDGGRGGRLGDSKGSAAGGKKGKKGKKKAAMHALLAAGAKAPSPPPPVQICKPRQPSPPPIQLPAAKAAFPLFARDAWKKAQALLDKEKDKGKSKGSKGTAGKAKGKGAPGKGASASASAPSASRSASASPAPSDSEGDGHGTDGGAGSGHYGHDAPDGYDGQQEGSDEVTVDENEEGAANGSSSVPGSSSVLESSHASNTLGHSGASSSAPPSALSTGKGQAKASAPLRGKNPIQPGKVPTGKGRKVVKVLPAKH